MLAHSVTTRGERGTAAGPYEFTQTTLALLNKHTHSGRHLFLVLIHDLLYLADVIHFWCCQSIKPFF